MKRITSTFITMSILSLCSCSVVTQQKPDASALTRDGKLWSSLWQQQAAEYKALCYQAYNSARIQLDEVLKNPAPKPLAVVTDIDETVLDNSPNAVSQALKGRDFEQSAWYDWTNKAACDTVPGSASFFKYAASKGVTVFYVTNRDEQEREATLRNLEKYGFPFSDNEHLLLKQTTSGKEPRRKDIGRTHEIIMLIGDNLSDFSSVFDKLPMEKREAVTHENSKEFGRRFIVLPNASYGDWENSLFKYNYKLNQQEKEKIILDILKKE